MRDCVIVGYGRSAIGKAGKGSLAGVNPVDFGAETLRGVLDRVPGLDPATIDDVILGCALPESALGLNPGRNVVLRAGLPDGVPAETVNRFCSSGLQAIADATARIRAGMADVVVAGGVEHMSSPVLSDTAEFRNPWLEECTAAYLPMGITGENVARRYGMTRTELDELAVQSNARAAAAREAGRFASQIVPVTGRNQEGEAVRFDVDEGIRPGTNLESLAGLRPAFAEDGLLSAATSSQRSDGAAFAVLMSSDRAAALGLRPLARLLGFAVAGVDPAYMGLGPVAAVPKVLAQVGLGVDDLAVIELNEAFASQALAVVRELGFDSERVNPNGGALAMGHPLGATGAILTAKLLAELERTDQRHGLVTMCVGGGMGAAGVFERI
ncbi:MAG: thiolase family protein [Propionicimonas sp.]|uniref:thiolase family protein n=1 Tax=Propionicimonas sp. TaxID=1955623 RepID=UPI002B204A03|nr:thiolase family protein [Propionicimonas sp.]MEA4944010.1 thiolase family protein [Propionicimonas sp.]